MKSFSLGRYVRRLYLAASELHRGVLLALLITGSTMNMMSMIGVIMLMGLVVKNAILVVEFAEQQRSQGSSLREATVEATRLRLRPIVMTSFAFILGLVPLVTAWTARRVTRTAQ